MNRAGVVIAAAGRSTRFGDTPKLLETIGGRTVLEWSILAFARRDDVGTIVVVTGLDLPQSCVRRGVITCPGGSCRAESVLRGLHALPKDTEWAMIHDAARPLVETGLISRVFAEAVRGGAAAPAVPVPWTIKEASGPLPGPVIRTLPRGSLFALQTPQIARRNALIHALEQCPVPLEQVTDDLQALELQGHPVVLVHGDETNLKITTKMDLELARLVMERRSAESTRTAHRGLGAAPEPA
jgi:2-C-methyl-D-erythritol 4-phosphate cytidylyltransferase